MNATLKIVKRFASYCGLRATERSWLVQRFLEEATRSARPVLERSGPSEPSSQELDAFEQVLRGLLANRPGRERAALRAKVARGCLRGVEQDDLVSLTDETVLEAAASLYEDGGLTAEDAHHLASFVGLFHGGPENPQTPRLSNICEDLIWDPALAEVQRVDLILAVIGCHDLPLPVRSQAVEAVASTLLPQGIGHQILERIVRGSSLYRPYWWAEEDDYLDARPGWMAPGSEEERRYCVEGLADLAMRLTPENRARSRAELDDLDYALSWLEGDDGRDAFEALALKLGGTLPEVLAAHTQHMAETPPDHVIPFNLLEADVQAQCDAWQAPHKCGEILMEALALLHDDLLSLGVDPRAFAESISHGHGEAEALLTDSAAHVLEDLLPEAIDRWTVPLGQLADLTDDEMARLRELALSVRDRLERREMAGMPPDLVELLSPFEGRTWARVNRHAPEDLMFQAARLLEERGMPREDLARLAATSWRVECLEMAGADIDWVAQLVSDHPHIFSSDLITAVRGGAHTPTKPAPGYN